MAGVSSASGTAAVDFNSVPVVNSKKRDPATSSVRPCQKKKKRKPNSSDASPTSQYTSTQLEELERQLDEEGI